MMQIILNKKPKNPIIIEGFPGVGLVGTISTEFLIDHLKTEQIGKVVSDELPAMIAIHDGKLVEPVGIFYNSDYNIVIIHAITGGPGLDYKMADIILKIYELLNARELITIEGVAASKIDNSETYFFSTIKKSREELLEKSFKPIKEGVIMGVTGVLLMKGQGMPITSVFAQTSTGLPDSKAAASVIKLIDNYLGLKVDYEPLLDQAEKMEEKISKIIKQGQVIQQLQEKKRPNYFG